MNQNYIAADVIDINDDDEGDDLRQELDCLFSEHVKECLIVQSVGYP